MRATVLRILLAAAALMAQTRPDFSGVWQLNKEKSNADVSTAWMRIQQSASALTINMRVMQLSQEETQTMRYTLGPEESSNSMHGAPMKSHTAWDGNTLVITSVAMFGTKPLRMTDRLSLGDDGKTLTFVERHQFGTEPEGVSTFVMDRRAGDAWPAEEKPKPAEEAYKNIQVLKGMPAPQLMTVMGAFTKSLGVDCGYCHLAGAFEKDDKAPKQTARAMLGMVTRINADNFKDGSPVTCWTCHRGSSKPQSQPPQ
jgi:hypothetical protein